MKKALTYLTVANLFFLALLLASGFFPSPVDKILYYLAFILPCAFVFIICANVGEQKTMPLSLKLDKGGALLTLPTVAPTLALIFLVSFLTSLVFSSIGSSPIPDVSGNILLVIVVHALLPALLEELFFRYMPLSVLTPYSKRAAVLYSALFFSLLHCSAYQMPYAFIAGIIFATLDLAVGSIWPSVILHFLNNLVSIFWIRNSAIEGFGTFFVIILASLALLSLIPVFIYRKKYSKMLTDVFNDKCKEKLSLSPIAFALCCILIAVMSL